MKKMAATQMTTEAMSSGAVSSQDWMKNCSRLSPAMVRPTTRPVQREF